MMTYIDRGAYDAPPYWATEGALLDFVTSGTPPQENRSIRIARILRNRLPGKPVTVDQAAMSVCVFHRPDMPLVRQLLDEHGYADVRVWFGGGPGAVRS